MDETINMTPELRLTLINQYKILAKVDNTDEYDRAISILENGFEFHYRDFGYHLNRLSVEECQAVRDALDTYEWLQYSYDSLSPADKKKTKEPLFWGYDFNNSVEGHYATYCEFLASGGQWAHVRTHGPLVTNIPGRQYWNSHGCAGSSVYRDQRQRFLQKWGKREFNDHGRLIPLTFDEINYVIRHEI